MPFIDRGDAGRRLAEQRLAALQNGQLMTQDENLDLFGCVGAGA